MIPKPTPAERREAANRTMQAELRQRRDLFFEMGKGFAKFVGTLNTGGAAVSLGFLGVLMNIGQPVGLATATLVLFCLGIASCGLFMWFLLDEFSTQDDDRRAYWWRVKTKNLIHVQPRMKKPFSVSEQRKKLADEMTTRIEAGEKPWRVMLDVLRENKIWRLLPTSLSARSALLFLILGMATGITCISTL